MSGLSTIRGVTSIENRYAPGAEGIITTSNPVVDLEFGIRALGTTDGCPADHGYALYGAVSRVLPFIHGHARLGIHPLNGRIAGLRVMQLDVRSRLAFRAPANLIPDLIPLAGRLLDVDGYQLQVGIPHVKAIGPAKNLYSRLVVIKGMQSPDVFLRSAKAQLEQLGVQGKLQLAKRRTSKPVNALGVGGKELFVRRTLKVKDRTIVGYAVEILGLSPEDSIRVQAEGLGGRRRFGCGVFTPSRAAQS